MVDNLEREVISVGTSRVLRVSRVGRTFFVENLVIDRSRNVDGEEHWKVVAVAKGQHAYQEAHEFLIDANREVIAAVLADQQRTSQGAGRASV